MDKDTAMLNPEREFVHSEDVLVESSVTHEQKTMILRRWEYDARELEVAEEENMGGASPSLLGEILNARHALNAGVDTEHSPPTKQGGQ